MAQSNNQPHDGDDGGGVIGHGIGGKKIPVMAHLAKARCWSKQ